MMYLQLFGGIAVLLASAEVFISGAVSLAKILRLPPLVTGMTVVAVGTSAPELMVTLDAALVGAPGLALGNVIGSNIANVLLILGVSCLISPMQGLERVNRRDGVVAARRNRPVRLAVRPGAAHGLVRGCLVRGVHRIPSVVLPQGSRGRKHRRRTYP